MNEKARLLTPRNLAIVGVLMVAFGVAQSSFPTLRAWLPTPFWSRIVPEVYPDASIVFLEESIERSHDFALVLANKKFTDSLTDRGIAWRVLDDDQPEAAELIEVAKSPCMLFVRSVDGVDEFEILATRELPKSSKEANDKIAEVMGK